MLFVFAVFVVTFVVIGFLGVGIEVDSIPAAQGRVAARADVECAGRCDHPAECRDAVLQSAALPFPAFLPPISFDLFGAVVTLKQIFILAFALLLMIGLSWFVNSDQIWHPDPRRVGKRADGTVARHQCQPRDKLDFFYRARAWVRWLECSMPAIMASWSSAWASSLASRHSSRQYLGGIGSIPGAMLGGFALGILETFGAGLLPMLTNGMVGSEYRDIFAFSVLVIVLIFRPAGFLGENVTEEGMVYKRDF